MFSVAGYGQTGSMRAHTIELRMPTRLDVRRTESQLSDSFHLASLRKVRIAVNGDAFLGLKDEIRVYRLGGPRPQSAGSLSYTSIDERTVPSESGYLSGAQSWDRLRDGIPAPGERYTVEHVLTVFETDVPPQHFWNAAIGNRYTVLWQRKLQADSR